MTALSIGNSGTSASTANDCFFSRLFLRPVNSCDRRHRIRRCNNNIFIVLLFAVLYFNSATAQQYTTVSTSTTALQKTTKKIPISAPCIVHTSFYPISRAHCFFFFFVPPDVNNARHTCTRTRSPIRPRITYTTGLN